MDNKYVYLSSIDADNAADFTVQFPNTISISPYSQVRLISAHIKAENNRIQITDDNNTFYMGADFWNKTTGSIPLTKITLDNGIYSLETFGEELQYSINGYFCKFNPLFFNGCIVSIDRNNEFQIELYESNLVGCPTIPFPTKKIIDAPELVVVSWQENNYMSFIIKDNNIFNKMGIYLDDIDTPIYDNGNEIFYGLTLATPLTDNSFFVGPSISSGLLSNTEFPIAIANIDLSGAGEAIEGDDYVQMWCGLCDSTNLSSDELDWGNFLNDDPETVLFKTGHRFCLQFMSDRLRIVYTDFVEGMPHANIIEILTEDGYENNGIYFAKCYDSYDDVSSYWKLYIIRQDEGNEILISEIEVRQNLVDNTNFNFNDDNISPNLAFMKKGAIDSYISFSCAYFGDKQINYFNAERREFYSEEDFNDFKNFKEFWDTDRLFNDRPISFFLSGAESFSNFLVLITKYSENDPDALYNLRLVLPTPATSGLAHRTDNESIYDAYVFIPNVNPDVIPTLSWSEFNFSSLPQAYLEIRELPLNNFTANYLQGSAQKFISPINFNFDSQTDQSFSLYTSNPNTEQFLTMSNSSKMVLSSFRVRICDITGKVFPLEPDTVITLEIRDNPTLRKERAQEQFISSIISKMSNGGQPGTVRNAKALDGF